MIQHKKALVIGATGLIGRSLVFELLKSPIYSQVTVLARRDLVIKHEKLVQVLLNFDDLENHEESMEVNDVFCCLGSTKAKTPDLTTYKKIDYEYPLQVAEMAKKKGATQFLLISSMGASLNSNIFYSKMKAEVELAIEHVNFESFTILRPSLLLGFRSESRPLETISQYLMRVLNPFFLGPLKLYKAIQGTTVAKAMVSLANKGFKGKRIVLNNQIFDEV
ncbi:MAG: NAD(P)H-binding protein [bacterium]|nr:NAD(P)H-binding protein [bacterium]